MKSVWGHHIGIDVNVARSRTGGRGKVYTRVSIFYHTSDRAGKELQVYEAKVIV